MRGQHGWGAPIIDLASKPALVIELNFRIRSAAIRLLVLTESFNSQGTRTASFFRVQKNLITEWQDVVVEAAVPPPATNSNAAACQTVNTALDRPR